MRKARPCKTPGCRNNARPSGAACHTCQAHGNPARYAYRHLKANAKRRGKEFSLTLEQFTAFAIETQYLDKRGKTATSYTIDRIDPTRGYHADNIQVLTNRENVQKQARELRTSGEWNPETRQMEFYTYAGPPVFSKPTFCPF